MEVNIHPPTSPQRFVDREDEIITLTMTPWEFADIVASYGASNLHKKESMLDSWNMIRENTNGSQPNLYLSLLDQLKMVAVLNQEAHPGLYELSQ